jgi:hypothetical protein
MDDRAAEELARECESVSLQRFIRENFGLYHPPGDYKALRAENLRRAKNPGQLTRRGSFPP